MVGLGLPPVLGVRSRVRVRVRVRNDGGDVKFNMKVE